MQLRQNILICLFFSVIALALMVPLASNTYLPASPPTDFAIHTGTIVQAKMAMEEGQFPLRIAPWQHEGYRYPEFQFYGPLPYTIAGTIYRWITPENPYIALKITLWLSLFLGGLYTYRLARCILNTSKTLATPIGLLAGFMYMSAPYFLINVNVRGDFTEAMAQGILSICLYYCLDTLINGINIRKIIGIALSIFALSTSHVVTFIYSSFFVSIFITLLTLISEKNKIYWKRWFGIVFGYIYGILLSAWYWGPMLWSHDFLQANHYLSDNALANPFNFNWLTPIAELLSPVAISPIPLPGNHLSTLLLSPSIGWPILLSIGAACFLIIMRRFSQNTKNTMDRKISLILLTLFSITFFAIWSPIDFWLYLPSYFRLVQFPYRLLMQANWMGVLLFIYVAPIFLLDTYKTQIERGFIISILFLGLASSSWLISPQSGLAVEEVLKKPSIQTDTDYLADGHRLFSPFFNNQEEAFIKKDVLNWTYDEGKTYVKLPIQWLILNKTVSFQWPSVLSDASPHFAFELTGSMRNTIHDHHPEPMTIIAQFNQQPVAKKTFPSGTFDWKIPLTHFVKKSDSPFFTLQFNRLFSKQGHSLHTQQHDINISHIQLIDWPLIPVKKTQHYCHISGVKTICTMDFIQKPTWVQLPMLYYPDLLDIKMDGHWTPIGHSFFDQLGSPVLTDIWVTPGHHSITAYFRGLTWANDISIAAWLILIIGSLTHLFLIRLKT